MEKLIIKDISKSFDGFLAVDQLSLEIKPGEFYSFLGPSGCGKTTLLRMIAGFETPTTGSIFLGSEDITLIPPYKRAVNTIFQNYSLFPHMTIFDNVAFGLRIKKTPKEEIKDKVFDLLKLVKMETEANKYINQISGGQKQRTAIARALINKPKVLLLDEPLAALDLKLRQHMLIELQNIHDMVGITFIYVTHDQGEAISISDRLAIMNKGRIIQEGTPDEIYESPNSIFSASFIGDANLITGQVKEILDDYVTLKCDAGDGTSYEIDSTFKFIPKVNQKVTVSLRPEKIAISRQEPEVKDDFNILAGKVEDILYFGTHTQYIVRVGNTKLRVYDQHKRVYVDDVGLDWEEKVYVFWHDTDTHLINEVINKLDDE